MFEYTVRHLMDNFFTSACNRNKDCHSNEIMILKIENSIASYTISHFLIMVHNYFLYHTRMPGIIKCDLSLYRYKNLIFVSTL